MQRRGGGGEAMKMNMRGRKMRREMWKGRFNKGKEAR